MIKIGPIGLGGVVAGGYLADWLRRRHRSANLLLTTVSVLLVAPLNLVSLLALTTQNLLIFTAVIVPTFLINTLHFSPLAAAVLDVAPAAQRASAVALSAFIQRLLGTALAPVVIGLLARHFDPSGLHFAQGLAGHDLVLALVITCPIAYAVAGMLGLAGLRWVGANRQGAR